MDLISTIGESAALGSAGVIFWGDSVYASSMVRETSPASQTWWGIYTLASTLTWVYELSLAWLPPKHGGFVPEPNREEGHPHTLFPGRGNAVPNSWSSTLPHPHSWVPVCLHPHFSLGTGP